MSNLLGLDEIYNLIIKVTANVTANIIMDYITELKGSYVKTIDFNIELTNKRSHGSRTPRTEIFDKGIIIVGNDRVIRLYDTEGKYKSALSTYYSRLYRDNSWIFWDQLPIVVYSNFILINNPPSVQGLYIMNLSCPEAQTGYPLVDGLSEITELPIMTIHDGEIFSVIKDRLQVSRYINETIPFYVIPRNIKLLFMVISNNELFTLFSNNVIMVFNVTTLSYDRYLNVDRGYEWKSMQIIQNEILLSTFNMIKIYNKFDGGILVSKTISSPVKTDGKRLYVCNGTKMDIYI